MVADQAARGEGAFFPVTLAEAVEIRARTAAVPLAGGTDLLVRKSRGAGRLPGFSGPVLWLGRCAELRGISAGDGGIRIGAATTLSEVAASPLVHPALRQAVLSMGGPGIRNAATLGGNLCNASPAGDTLPFLYAFDAVVRLRSPAGERAVPLGEFITGPGRTAIRADELLTCVVVSVWSPAVWSWRKVGTRRANALTKVSLAGFADVEDGRLARVRLALGAVGPTVLRARDAEKLLEGARTGTGGQALLAEVHAAVRSCATPIDDQRSTAVYRSEVAANLAREFARRALGAPAARRGMEV